MPAFHLNPNATEFIPGSLGLVACPVDDGFDHPDVSSMVKSIPVSSASSEDFMELRAVDAWLNMMVDLEELEQDHLISLALRYTRNVVLGWMIFWHVNFHYILV
mmetsp:Transcript_3285/g.6158  ORF Transcript_3285/g.6158 Transcript_3285/m.6158 type:complete len:104 (-) Transcript_3285:884-1195(-)